MSTTMAVPFGVRHLTSPETTGNRPVMTYNDVLQLNVSASGNPWHSVAAMAPETQSETSNGDGSSPGSDSGTDLW